MLYWHGLFRSGSIVPSYLTDKRQVGQISSTRSVCTSQKVMYTPRFMFHQTLLTGAIQSINIDTYQFLSFVPGHRTGIGVNHRWLGKTNCVDISGIRPNTDNTFKTSTRQRWKYRLSIRSKVCHCTRLFLFLTKSGSRVQESGLSLSRESKIEQQWARLALLHKWCELLTIQYQQILSNKIETFQTFQSRLRLALSCTKMRRKFQSRWLFFKPNYKCFSIPTSVPHRVTIVTLFARMWKIG